MPRSSDRYRIDREVGRGGMGRVVQADDQALMRRVAMKLLRGRDPGEVMRFAREARITAQLDHPAILPVYDLGRDPDGTPFFTMKLVEEHESLQDLVRRLRQGGSDAQAWTFRRRVQLVQVVCQAVSYAHQRGVVHGDLKPANVVLGSWGQVYLVDWGIAAVQRAADVRLPADSPEEEFAGTPAYMAPELALEGQRSVASDVYALSAVLYELLTLEPPLGTHDNTQALARLARDERPRDAESHADPIQGRVPRTLSRICRKGLARDPAQRHASPTDLEQALQDWLEGKVTVVCPGTCMQRTASELSDLVDRHPVLVPFLVVTALALGTVGLISLGVLLMA